MGREGRREAKPYLLRHALWDGIKHSMDATKETPRGGRSQGQPGTGKDHLRARLALTVLCESTEKCPDFCPRSVQRSV